MKSKYMEPSVPGKLMKGKGAPKPSVFGIVGNTKTDNFTKTLGGIVYNTKVQAKTNPSFKPGVGYNTENGLLGKHATVPSQDVYGQVPYQGKFCCGGGKSV